MPRYKGTRYVTMRKVMQDFPRESEGRLIDVLESREKEKYLNAQAITWFDVKELPEQGEMFTTAAAILFPGDAGGLEKVGALNAKASLTGIYKLFLRIPSTDFVLRRVAQVWRSYQDTGNASVERAGSRQFNFVIRDFPELAGSFRTYLTGYIRGVLELTGVQHPAIHHLDGEPGKWMWHITW